MPAPTSTVPEERDFVVDSLASMHMLSKKGVELRRTGDSAEIQEPHNGGEGQWRSANKRGSTGTFLRSWSLRNSADTRGDAWESSAMNTDIPMSGPAVKSHPTKGTKILCKTENFVPLVVRGLSSKSGTSSSSTSLPQDPSSTSWSPATKRSDDGAPGNWRDSPKTQNKNQKKDNDKTFRNGYGSSQKISKIQKCLHPHTLLMTLIRNGLQRWHPGNTVFSLTSRKNEIAKYACETKWQGLLAEDALA